MGPFRLAVFLAAMMAMPLTASAEPLDSSGYALCVLEKIKDAQKDGVTPNLPRLRELCLQAIGDSTVVRPVEGGSPEIKRAFCQAYAADAAERGNFGQQNCGLNDARFSVYEEDHVNWCMSVPAAAADAERRARRYALHDCRLCLEFADLSLAQHRQAARCIVPPTGPHWHVVSYDVHRNWCREQVAARGNGGMDVIKVLFGRYNDLENCGDKNRRQVAP